MFTQLATWYPSLGKESEMLANGTEFVKARQARGERYALVTRLYSAIGPAFTVTRQYRDLAEADAVRATNQADPDFHAAVARASVISRAAPTQRLWEAIVPVNGLADAKYIAGTTLYPAPGNTAAVRSLLTAWVQSEQARRNIGLSVDLYHTEGIIYTVTAAHASLSSVEEHRRASQEDAGFQTLAAEVGKLVRKPATSVLSAVIVPYQR